ncbi:DUF6541 family protein [Amycolatopsis pigmentata]|uniref:DUF6541 family protein n=1 Tax=Amycolatopsis pigmentata TaxID=450801 RepID=A0ABW5FSG0_9PSEU
MSWSASLPIGLVSIAWLLVPGLLVTYGIGLRGIAAWAIAPVVTIAETAGLAVVARKLSVPWSAPLVAGVCGVIALVTATVAFVVRRRAPARPSDPRAVTLAAVLGLVPAGLLGVWTVVRGFGEPDMLSQTFDAVFHYNAVAWILDTRNASSLSMGALGVPGVPETFYPGAWHDLVSLVVLTTGTSIPVATNLVAASVALVLWPLSCLFLVRQVIGRSPAAMAITGVLSLGFTAFPWSLLGWGVLWPNLLGMSIAPSALAVVVSVCGLATDDAIGRARAWALSPVVAVALALAHPNVLFSVVVLAVFPVFTALIRRALRLRWRGVAEIAVAVAIFLLGWWWAATTPVFAAVRSFHWNPVATPSQAVGQVLRNATDGYDSLWLLSALVLLGALAALRSSNRFWLVAGQIVSAVLYVLSASVNTPSTQKFTGYWYNDSYRLAAMVPITAVPLAVVAILLLAKWIGRVSPAGWRTPVAVGLAAVTVAATFGLYLSSHITALATWYIHPFSDRSVLLVDGREHAFFDRIKAQIPPGALVAGDPWNGSALLWALEDRKTLMVHLDIATTADQDYLGAHLIDAATDPKVCPAAERLGVRYFVTGDNVFWPDSPARKKYPGLADPGGRPGFRPITEDGPLKLYEITACSR